MLGFHPIAAQPLSALEAALPPPVVLGVYGGDGERKRKKRVFPKTAREEINELLDEVIFPKKAVLTKKAEPAPLQLKAKGFDSDEDDLEMLLLTCH
jgi:hypothetical protein